MVSLWFVSHFVSHRSSAENGLFQMSEPLANVAFRNPDGRVVVVVVKAECRERPFRLICAGQGGAVRLRVESFAESVC